MAVTKPKKQSPLVAALIEGSTRARKFALTDAMKRDVADVVAVNAKGEHFISAMALARALKSAYKLTQAATTIRDHVIEEAGGKW